ncbi:hypothetical protein HMPREF3222_02400 [Clostridium perfringens]|uniref:Uncharacterized protein n=1 Tax=Clostridium perfringens TaxID=1502 RepID=A0A133MX28_CLOPF|nr:hypothetical protein HMPREF3222_02400 [Clostridium perfringens]
MLFLLFRREALYKFKKYVNYFNWWGELSLPVFYLKEYLQKEYV